MTGFDTPRDWRGTPIRPGALAIYIGAETRSGCLAEGRVADPMFTPSGRIWVDVVRRSHSQGEKSPETTDRVHVAADRLTIVDGLPPSAAPTVRERRAEARRTIADRSRTYDTHQVADHGARWDDRHCQRCGVTGAGNLGDIACTEASQ